MTFRLTNSRQSIESGWEQVSSAEAAAVWKRGSEYSIRLPEGIEARIVSKSRVEVFSPLTDSSATADFVLRRIVPRIAAHLGVLVLHAACVEMDGHGILLLGPSGRGKSTLSAALTLAGARFVADDITWIGLGSEPIAVPGIPDLHLRSPCAEEMSSLIPASWTRRSTAGRVRWTPPASDRPTSLGLACWLGPPERDDVSPRVLSPIHSFEKLISSAFQLDSKSEKEARTRFSQACWLAEQITVAASPRPDWPRLDPWRSQLLSLMRAGKTAAAPRTRPVTSG